MNEPIKNIPMVDLVGQYREIEPEVLEAIRNTIESSAFINGPQVHDFAKSLEKYCGAKKVIPCGNGTDALQIALMALDLEPGDEVIVPAFTYIATAEVIGLLNLKPVLVDVDPDTFNIVPGEISAKITEKTRAIVPVHLFGQCAHMEEILKLAGDIPVIEDAAQSLGSEYTFSDGRKSMSGTMGIIGTTSFFPSKNLGAYGDGGALMTMDLDTGEKIRLVANHGQTQKYYHDIIGVNSRLDSLQAAILSVKLNHLDEYRSRRQAVAGYYDNRLKETPLQIPVRTEYSTHVFHQYTLKIDAQERDSFRKHLSARGVPTAIYYPLPVHLQEGYKHYGYKKGELPVSEDLCNQVISIPIHTQMKEEDLDYICSSIESFF